MVVQAFGVPAKAAASMLGTIQDMKYVLKQDMETLQTLSVVIMVTRSILLRHKVSCKGMEVVQRARQ